MEQPNRKRLLFKSLPAAAILIGLMLTLAGASLAWLISETSPIVNTFTLGKVDVEIEETFDAGNTAKTSIIIQNPENPQNVDAYVRVALIPMIVDGDGEIQGEQVSLVELGFKLNTGEGWFDGGDGYYYYKNIVPVNGATASLIPDGDHISLTYNGKPVRLDVIADAVQARPAAAVTGVWPVTVNEDETLGGGAS